MTELRAPDPTLSELDAQVVWLDGTQEPQVAHSLACLGEEDDRPEQFLWRSLSVDAARWFAVPCRDCFPEAPPAGHIRGTNEYVDAPALAWQVPVGHNRA